MPQLTKSQPTSQKFTSSVEQLRDENKSARAITIVDHLPAEVYEFFRDLSNLPFFMKGILSVTEHTQRLSHWVAKLSSGMRAEWDAEITHEVPGSMISWDSIKGSDVATRGTIWFTKCPLNRGTVVSLSMDYDIPGGILAEWATLLTGEDPDSLAITNLHRLKAYLETDEIPTIQGQSSGREEDLAPPLKH